MNLSETLDNDFILKGFDQFTILSTDQSRYEILKYAGTTNKYGIVPIDEDHEIKAVDIIVQVCGLEKLTFKDDF